MSFRRGFRILAAVDWRFLRFRFTSTVEAVMHTVREPDLRPPTPPPLRSPGLLPTAHRSSLLSLSLSLSSSLASPCSSPRCLLFFLFHPPPSNSASAVRRRLSLLPRGERESVLSNFLADISRYNNWAFSANLPFFSSRLGLLCSPFTGGGSLNYIPRAMGEGLSANGQRARANPVRGTNGNIFHRRMRWIA